MNIEQLYARVRRTFCLQAQIQKMPAVMLPDCLLIAGRAVPHARFTASDMCVGSITYSPFEYWWRWYLLTVASFYSEKHGSDCAPRF